MSETHDSASLYVPSHAVLITGSRTFTNENLMRQAFNRVWATWQNYVPNPLLIAGGAPNGADALAERLWRSTARNVRIMPADWNQYGKRAGFIRNQQMVDHAVQLREAGVLVQCIAFLDACHRTQCTQRAPHYSHGTEHCRGAIIDAGLPVLDVFA